MDDKTDILSSSQVPYPTYTPYPGWIQQNPSDWIEASIDAVKICFERLNLNMIDKDISVIKPSSNSREIGDPEFRNHGPILINKGKYPTFLTGLKRSFDRKHAE